VGMRRFLPIALAALAAGVAALAVNFLLVGFTADRNDPVGKLSPRAPLTTNGNSATTTDGDTTTLDEPTTTGETTTGETTTGDDSGRGRGRGRGGDGSSDDD
jgi:hypothetical protein